MNKFDLLIKHKKRTIKGKEAYYMIDVQDDDANKRGPNSIYKYIDLVSFIECLKNGNIQFTQPIGWPDQYEQHFYCANYGNITENSDDTPKFWACCFTKEDISEALWKTYTYGKQGLGNRCVKIKLNRKRMRECIIKDSKVKSLYEGFVNYTLLDSEIQKLHHKKANGYNWFFGTKFSLENYFSLMLIKRKVFEYEQEFRFMITADEETVDPNEKERVYVNTDWSSVIEDIVIDNECSDIEEVLLRHYLDQAKVKIAIAKSKLYEDPCVKPIVIQGNQP